MFFKIFFSLQCLNITFWNKYNNSNADDIFCKKDVMNINDIKSGKILCDMNNFKNGALLAKHAEGKGYELERVTVDIQILLLSVQHSERKVSNGMTYDKSGRETWNQ